MNTTTSGIDTQVWSAQGPACAVTRTICPKVNKFEKGYLYVALLSTGWLKIGRTADPVDRFSSILRGLRSTGISFCAVAVTHAHVNVVENEKIALGALKHVQRDGEYFLTPFEAATQLIASLNFKTAKSASEVRAAKNRYIDAYNAINTGFGTREGSLK